MDRLVLKAMLIAKGQVGYSSLPLSSVEDNVFHQKVPLPSMKQLNVIKVTVAQAG